MLTFTLPQATSITTLTHLKFILKLVGELSEILPPVTPSLPEKVTLTK